MAAIMVLVTSLAVSSPIWILLSFFAFAAGKKQVSIAFFLTLIFAEGVALLLAGISFALAVDPRS